jgi:flagellar biosynthetic protein FlhB
MSDQRTEDPTHRRREEARRKGEGIGRSHELAMGATLSVVVLALPAMLPSMAATLAVQLRGALVEMGDARIPDGRLLDVTANAFGQLVGLIVPFSALIAAAGFIAYLAAGGFVLAPSVIRFDLSKLDPLKGLRRIMDKQALIRLALALGKMCGLAVIGWSVLAGHVARLLALGGAEVTTTVSIVLDAVRDLGVTMMILLGVVAIVDFAVQRRKAKNDLRMTKSDVRQEGKETEGDPLVRARRRRRAREMASARMMAAVETADVVIVNPIHFAVALKYDSLTMRAPRIVAKGQRLMADRIREAAIKSGVSIVQDIPLARALYGRPIGAEVPQQLYRAVARILIVVHQARFGRRSTMTGAPR